MGLLVMMLHRTGLGTGAEQRALRAAQGLDALDIVNVDVQVGADGGDRLLIQVQTDAGR